MKKIDYTKLNERIVAQAYTSSGLTPKQVTELYAAKVARAEALVKARTETYIQIED